MNQRPSVIRRQVLISGGLAAAAPLLPGTRRAPSPVGKPESLEAEKTTDIMTTAYTAPRREADDIVTTGLNIAIQPGADILCQMGPVWTPSDPPVTLHVGQSLYSPGRAFRLTMQDDGNAVLQYVETNNLPHGWPTTPLPPSSVTWIPIWATYTENQSAAYLAMQWDGNFVVYHSDGTRQIGRAHV